MFRTSLLPSIAAVALSACGEAPTSPDLSEGPAGGKADDVRACEEGRTCLQFRSYDVLFTNPVCGTYEYETAADRVGGGDALLAKPKNVYCSKADSAASGARATSPQTRILDWIDDAGEGDEVFLTYLSFSDELVANALCEAEGRGAEVTFVLDKFTSKAQVVEDCGGDILIRGHQGSIQFAHTKILMINPRAPGPADADEEFVRFSFGSGNMSSGTHLHHENWHFMEVARDSFFVQSHLCLMDALLPEEHTDGKTAFKTFMNACRDEIELPREDDMIPFFIPVRDDSKALTELLLHDIEAAETIDIGAHRFSYKDMIVALSARLSNAERPFHLRLVADDDLYWLDPLSPSRSEELGPNSFGDLSKLQDLRDADGDRARFEERYLETNHSARLLHHNKFLIFNGMPGGRDTLIVGSSNLTGTGFNDNLENMYWTDIPEIVDAFKAQYDLFWDGEGPLPEGTQVPPLATAPEDMPVDIITIDAPTDPGGGDPDPERACGLRVAEVFYDPSGADNGKEWVKLYNNCDDAIDLAGKSLAWGGSSWAHAGLDLEGVVEGGACVIVGGGPDADVEADFSPDIQNAGRRADGLGVFEVRASAVTETMAPLDAVIYGGENSSGLVGPSGEALAPDVADVLAGQSIVRVAEDVWERASTPTPGDCPTF